MRLSTGMIYQLNLKSVTNSYSAWMDTGLQLAANQKVNKPSDDPIASSQVVRLNQTVAMNTQYASARTTAESSLNTESSTLDQVTTAITSIQTLLVQAGDGTLSDSDRQSLATSIQSAKDTLLDLANTKDGNGNYMFAGYKTGTAPFVEDADGNVTYVGGTTAVSQQVDSSRTMQIGNTGEQVFMSLTAGYTTEPDGEDSVANVFDSINIALTALNTPQDTSDDDTTAAYTAAIDKAIRGLSNSANTVSTVQGSVGSQLNELDTLDSIGDDRSIINTTRITSLLGADTQDTIEIASNYSQQQVALQAAYSAFTSMQSMSLFQMSS